MNQMNSCDQGVLASLVNEGVRHLSPYVPGKPVEELERELGIKEIVKLASNENPLGPSVRAVAAIQQALPALSRYPDGSAYRLKKVLAEKLSVSPGQITIGNGSNEILELVARAFVTPAHEVIYSQHGFAVYPLVAQAIGAKGVKVPAKDWGNDLDGMLNAVNEKTRLVFIANPNNPTGTWNTQSALYQFLQRLPSTVICVVDEAYFEYVMEDEYGSALSWLKQFPNLLVSRTFSKAYGLAGLRIGYSVCSEEMADYLNRVRQPFNNNQLALVAAEHALLDEAHLTQSVQLNFQGMQQIVEGLGKLGLSCIPSVANFVSVDLGRPVLELNQSLLQQGVIVRPVGVYEMPHHLRISIGLEKENAFFLQKLQLLLNGNACA